MGSLEGKQQAASAAAEDAQACLGNPQPRLETGSVTSCGTPLDLGSDSSTAAGTSARESGRSSLEPKTTDCSDTSRTEPGPAHTKDGRRRRKGDGAGVTHARRNTRYSKRGHVILHAALQRGVKRMSERLDAQCWEVSKLRIGMLELRARLLERESIDTGLDHGAIYWRELNERLCPKADAGCTWGKMVPDCDT